MSETSFTRYQKFVIVILAFLQFTIILDFMILSPLGAVILPTLNISPKQFGLVVSVYAFSAGSAGLLSAGFADKYDRKKLLFVFYCGFLLGTLLCGLASTFEFLLFARMVTGIFGGVVGSVVFAITTDLFSFTQRGRVMGFIQTAFAGSQVLGIPAGLYLSNLGDWHTPFLMIVGIGAIVGIFIWIYLKPIDEHLKLKQDSSPIHHFVQTITNRRYVQAFATTALLSTGGFMLMPFGTAFTVNNVGIPMDKQPMIYLITGICAIFTGPMVGRMTDKVGKFKMFSFGSALSVVMVLIYTHMGKSSLAYVVSVNAILFIGIFSRMIPSQALMSAIPTPASRGAFMSVSSSIQQISGGIAAVLAGFIVVQQPSGYLENFDVLGYVVIGATMITMVLMYQIHMRVPERPA